MFLLAPLFGNVLPNDATRQQALRACDMRRGCAHTRAYAGRRDAPSPERSLYCGVQTGATACAALAGRAGRKARDCNTSAGEWGGRALRAAGRGVLAATA